MYKKNLISIIQLIPQNYKVIFNNHNNSAQVIIYNDKGNKIYKSTSNNKNTFKIFISKLPITFIPKELRTKFDNNSHPGIFLGYCNSTSTYKIPDLTNNKIIISCTVKFMENDPSNSLLHFIIQSE